MTPTASAQQVTLGFLGAARGRALLARTLVAGAEILGVSTNATRLALSRLRARGELQLTGRGRYALSAARQRAAAHVRTFRNGFAARVPWRGGFVGVLTSALSRRSSSQVARRERALNLSGFREFRRGLWVRPDNLAGGRVVVTTHLRQLGLDEEAATLELRLDAGQLAEVERKWNVAQDQARAQALTVRVHRFLARGQRQGRRARAAESFWLGDEVLRFLARDPLLPEAMADPEPRARLAEAMAALDEQGFALWSAILEELEE